MLEFKNKENVLNNITKYTKITKALSLIRLILALSIIVFVIAYFSDSDNYIYLILFIILTFITTIFIPYSNKYYNKLNEFKNSLNVYEIHTKRRNNKYHTFDDNGFDLKDKLDYKEADLDLFGKHSLFQYLNCCKTKYGRNKLKDSLINKQEYDEDYINTVKKLSETEDSIKLESSLHNFDKDSKNLDYDFLLNGLTKKIKFEIKFLIPLIWWLGLIGYIIYTLIKGFEVNYLYHYFLLFIVLNIISVFSFSNEIFNYPSIRYYELCSNYEIVISTINEVDIDTKTYKNIKEELNKNKESIKSVKSILNLLSLRGNFIIKILLNSFLIFDFWVILLYNHKNRKTDGLNEVFENVGKLECILSLSTIGCDNEVYTTGFNNDTDKIEGVSMYHPLVKDCVDNSFDLCGGVILTGSNMSGKTTFMRTLAICETLFNANGLVPAKSYKAPKLSIYTSLRANDMLSEGISTFYAEILRMKKINQAISNEKCLILVDEIFKGTNAIERISASNQVIDKLSLNNVLFIISTHDFELCDNKNIINYHFNETYQDDKIQFDYKIKEGKSDTKNAIYLLKMAEII